MNSGMSYAFNFRHQISYWHVLLSYVFPFSFFSYFSSPFTLNCHNLLYEEVNYSRRGRSNEADVNRITSS